jgi:hypothetical protein
MYWEPTVVDPVRAKPRIAGGGGGAEAAAGVADAWANKGRARAAARERQVEKRMGAPRRRRSWR